jgi:phospholipid/cholesterol/gamma-HCH transport system permease protein
MQAQGQIDLSQPTIDTLQAILSGQWQIGSQLPSTVEILAHLNADAGVQNLILDAGGLAEWDSSLLIFIRTLEKICRERNIAFDMQGLPDGIERLMHLASIVPEQRGTAQKQKRRTFLYMVGESTADFGISAVQILEFLGDTTLSFFRFLAGRASFRRIDFLIFMEECGADSLPIVTLISVLVGLILAFVGAVQLKLFGAQIYVADLVAISMAREMGALMTGIIMSGRIGAAYAAQLGTMQVNEEIDALTTMGISPMDFLVLPRLFAMVIMMPLLALYSDLLGIIGGAIVGMGMMDITLVQYYTQTQSALDLTNISLGVAKAGIYASIIALSGCLRGMQSGRSAAAVGAATTSAVVTAIVWIIVTDGIFAVLCNALGI